MICAIITLRKEGLVPFPHEATKQGGRNMKINIIGRQLNVYDDTRELIKKKLSKLDKYFRNHRRSCPCDRYTWIFHHQGAAS